MVRGPIRDLGLIPNCCKDQELQLLFEELSSMKMTSVERHFSNLLNIKHILSLRKAVSSSCFRPKMFSAYSRTVAKTGVRNFKVAVLGASGGIGQPLALLLKLDRNVTELALFDVVKTPGVAADISHCCTPAKVFFCERL